MVELAERAGTPGTSSDLRERARLVLEIVAAYTRARQALRREPLPEVLAAMRSARPARSRFFPDEGAEARHLASAVSRTLVLLPGDTRCLSRSLVLMGLLARRGITARLVIGARSTPTFGAHAWVEHDGRPVLPAGELALGRLTEL